jgi:hypothetical protein
MTGSQLLDHFALHADELTAAERTAIIAFDGFSSAPGWRPRDPYLGSLFPVLEVGLLAEILKEKKGTHDRLTRAVKDAQKLTRDPIIMSELHVGAILAKLGYQVNFPPRSKKTGVRTPDLQCVDDQGICIDVEVVRADERHGHRIHRENMSMLIDVIRVEENMNYAIFIDGRIDDDLLMALLDELVAMRPGEYREKENHWAIATGRLEDRDLFVGSEQMKLHPKWWGEGPSFFANIALIGGANSPVGVVKTKVPEESYSNPVRRKADRSQRINKDSPYIIAFDLSDLPTCYVEIENELEEFYKIWPEVSAVLVERPMFVLHSQYWQYVLLLNPYACRPISLSEPGGVKQISV